MGEIQLQQCCRDGSMLNITATETLLILSFHSLTAVSARLPKSNSFLMNINAEHLRNTAKLQSWTDSAAHDQYSNTRHRADKWTAGNRWSLNLNFSFIKDIKVKLIKYAIFYIFFMVTIVYYIFIYSISIKGCFFVRLKNTIGQYLSLVVCLLLILFF